MSIESVIDGIISAEGGYSNNPLDPGGETNFGITAMTAKRNGYYGAMKDLPVATARQIYKNVYWLEPHFDRVEILSPSVAEELCDTGVNCGIHFASTVLQDALNLLNRNEADYKDIKADGTIGPIALGALGAYLMKRGKEGETVLVRVLNVMQGARYIEIVKTKPTQEAFFYGWMLNRVKM